MGDPAFEDWKQRAADVDLLSAASIVGARLKPAGGGEYVGPCPECGGTDRFSINVNKRKWNCRGSKGGVDAIGMVTHAGNMIFMQACEALTGEPPPNAKSDPIDPEVARERAQERRAEAARREREEQQAREKKALRAADVFEMRKPILRTHADYYLRGRGILLLPHQAIDLGFIPLLQYRGFRDADAEENEVLGEFPCMVAAIRTADLRLIGVHRTYLDLKEPKKLKPPGDTKRNKAKKVFGLEKTGFIRLGEIGEFVAMGEGIETTLGWSLLPCAPEGVTLMAGVSLGNISGGALETVPHPNISGRYIQNGEPDPAKPGVILPPQVKRLRLLGDGDSDPPTTTAHLLTAVNRYSGQGVEVTAHVAPSKKDWANIREEALRVAA